MKFAEKITRWLGAILHGVSKRDDHTGNMNQSIVIGTKMFPLTSEHINLAIGDVTSEMLAQLSKFPRLRSLNAGCTNLNDEGLRIVSNLSGLEQLNIQETDITDNGLQYLKNMSSLRDLRMKGNPQLTNSSIKHFKDMDSLKEIGIHETGIDQDGLQELLQYCELTDVCIEVWEDNFQFDTLMELSRKHPECEILAKGHGIFSAGEFNGKW